jgi:hypothetical protein
MARRTSLSRGLAGLVSVSVLVTGITSIVNCSRQGA